MTRNSLEENRPNHWILVTVAVFGGTLGMASLSQAGDAIIPLINAEGTMCLQPINGSTNPGDAIVQAPCDGSAAQMWQKAPISSGQYHLINTASHLCLDARGGAAKGTPIEQWACDEITNINWRIAAGQMTLISAVSNTSTFCVTSVQTGAAVSLQPCAKNNQAQVWFGPISICPKGRVPTPCGCLLPNVLCGKIKPSR